MSGANVLDRQQRARARELRTRRERLTTGPALVNDVHSQLNPTRVRRCIKVQSLDALRAALSEARVRGCQVSVAGGRHAMGGQQFWTNAVLVDLSGLDRVLAFDPAAGQIEVEAGIQ